MDEFAITDLLDAIAEYKAAHEAYDNDPMPEYGIGTWGAETKARLALNEAFEKAVKSCLI